MSATATSPKTRRAILVAVSVFLFILLIGPYLGLGRSSDQPQTQDSEAPVNPSASRPRSPGLFDDSRPSAARARESSTAPQKPSTRDSRGRTPGSDKGFSEIEDLLGN